MGTLPDGVRADAVQMPGTGAQPRRAEEVPLQEQADEPGWKHHRFVGEHVRLGQIPADQGGDQTAPAAGPRWLPAVVRGGDRGSSSTVCDAKWRQLVDSTQGDASRREILVSRRLSQIAENRSCYPQLSARS